MATPSPVEKIVRKDRGTVLASALIKEMAQTKMLEIRKREIGPRANGRPSIAVRHLHRRYRALKKRTDRALARISQQAQRLGWGVGGHQPYLRDEGNSARQNRHNQEKAALLAKVATRRTDLLILLISASPQQAQRHARAFQQWLEKL